MHAFRRITCALFEAEGNKTTISLLTCLLPLKDVESPIGAYIQNARRVVTT